jgi:hypothetical protein
LKQFVALPIANFPEFTGKKVGQQHKSAGQQAPVTLSGL